MKTTDWFPSHVKPKRKGWYEISFDYGRAPIKRYFDGRIWRMDDKTLDLSIFGYSAEFADDGDVWRGLAEKP